MILGRLQKQGDQWSADAEVIGAFTQGASLRDAIDMLASLIKLQVGRDGFEVTIREIGHDEGGATLVYIESRQIGMLAARVLKHQRELHKLTLADVQDRLGAASVNAYAAYEQGKREPSLSKFQELLAAVAPELAMTVAPRRKLGT